SSPRAGPTASSFTACPPTSRTKTSSCRSTPRCRSRSPCAVQVPRNPACSGSLPGRGVPRRRFLYDSEATIAAFPRSAKRSIGVALRLAQLGRKADYARPRTGYPEFRGAKVYEIDVGEEGVEYRTVYTVEFQDAIYVIDAFIKKSRRGIATPPEVLDRI